jgi:hypothetical protein
VHVDPHTTKKWGGQDPGTPTGSPPMLAFSLIEFFFNLTHETVPSPTSFIASSATCRYAHFELGCVNRLYVRCPEKLDNVQAGNPVPAQKYGGFCGL